LRGFEGELAAFLLVARATIHEGSPPADSDYEVAVRRTEFRKCERCWTYRADVAADGPRPGLCSRCAAVLDATGREVQA
jgi:isoleucyl-tRNA synthetase